MLQTDCLTGDVASMDIATEKNMQDLIDIGKDLLKQSVARVNIDTGVYEPVHGEGTNEQALKNFARMLSNERRSRPMTPAPSSHLPRVALPVKR